MKSKSGFYLIVLVLVITGLSLAWLRHTELQVPFQPGQKKAVGTGGVNWLRLRNNRKLQGAQGGMDQAQCPGAPDLIL
jgi:hypothetical protein